MISSDQVILEANRSHAQGYDGGMFPHPELIKQYQAYELVSINPFDLNISGKRIYQTIVDNYAKMDTDFPPIILSDRNEVIDGFHRVAAAKYLGLTSIKAYKPIY